MNEKPKRAGISRTGLTRRQTMHKKILANTVKVTDWHVIPSQESLKFEYVEDFHKMGIATKLQEGGRNRYSIEQNAGRRYLKELQSGLINETSYLWLNPELAIRSYWGESPAAISVLMGLFWSGGIDTNEPIYYEFNKAMTGRAADHAVTKRLQTLHRLWMQTKIYPSANALDWTKSANEGHVTIGGKISPLAHDSLDYLKTFLKPRLDVNVSNTFLIEAGLITLALIVSQAEEDDGDGNEYE